MKNIVIAVIGLLIFVFGAEAQEAKKQKRWLGGLITYTPQQDGEVARYKQSYSYTTEERIYVRPDYQSQWGFPASKLPPKARNSTTVLDLGRYRYEREQRGTQSYAVEGYDYVTGNTYHSARSDSSTNVVVYKEPAYRIPYHSLPSRGTSQMPKGYQTTVIGVVPLKPLITGPVVR